MTVWVVRGGDRGQYEDTFVSEGLVGIHFGLDISAAGFNSKESLRDHMATVNGANQMWNFIHEIRVGDMIVLPRKSPKVIKVGRVSGDYQYRNEFDAPHVRAVDWKEQDIPRPDFDQDLLNSIGGLATVFRIRATDAEARIDAILGKQLGVDVADDAGRVSLELEAPELKIDLEEQLNDRIIERIRQRFPGAKLEYLVAEILRASGYRALNTQPGPDGGIDVLAGRGDMGFGHPWLCVQVKSGKGAVDLPDYDRLRGNIVSFGADHGLLVSLGDFTRPVRKENEHSFFQIRLWGPDELVERLGETYPSLPDDIRNNIPLRNRPILMETEQ